jgi:hypothetical protein
MGNSKNILYFYYMTNVKISETGKAILRNKALRSAIAKVMTERSHEVSTSGVIIKIDGQDYTIKTASSLTEEDIASMNKK